VGDGRALFLAPLAVVRPVSVGQTFDTPRCEIVSRRCGVLGVVEPREAADYDAAILSSANNSIIPYLITTHLLTPRLALRLVDLLEKILFPLDGYPAPSPPDPTAEEARVMRREIEERLSVILPSKSWDVSSQN